MRLLVERNAAIANATQCPQCTCNPIIISPGEINLILLGLIILIIGFAIGVIIHKKGWI